MNNLSSTPSREIAAEVAALRQQAQIGGDYKKLQELAQPKIDILNERAKSIAKRFGKTARKFTFQSFGKTFRTI